MSVKDTTVVRVPNELLPQVNDLILSHRNKKKEEKAAFREKVQKLLKSGVCPVDEQMVQGRRVFIVGKDRDTPSTYDRVKNYERSVVLPVTCNDRTTDVEVHVISGQMYITKSVYREVFKNE